MLSHERQSAQMSEIENGRLGLYCTEHLNMVTLDFKGWKSEMCKLKVMGSMTLGN